MYTVYIYMNKQFKWNILMTSFRMFYLTYTFKKSKIYKAAILVQMPIKMANFLLYSTYMAES